MSLKAGFVKFVLNLQLSKHTYIETQMTRHLREKQKRTNARKGKGSHQYFRTKPDRNQDAWHKHTQTHTSVQNPVRQVH